MPILPILLAGIQNKTKEEAQELMRHPERLLNQLWAAPYLKLARDTPKKEPEPFWQYGEQVTMGLKEYKDLILSSNPKNWRVKRKSKSHFQKHLK